MVIESLKLERRKSGGSFWREGAKGIKSYGEREKGRERVGRKERERERDSFSRWFVSF